jgi:hypothetical protein
MHNKTYDQLSRRWHFLKFEDISAVTDEHIIKRLDEILAIEAELKARWDDSERGIYEPHGFAR